MSVRSQVNGRKARKGKTRRVLKHKKIKKIRTPRKKDLQPTQSHSQPKSQDPNPKKGILQQSGGSRKTKNKTLKKVRFNLESQGIQTGKFRNAHRVKMKTAKNRRRHRSKNRTLKNTKFKIRITDTQEHDNEVQEMKGNLLDRLKNFKELSTDVAIVRV